MYPYVAAETNPILIMTTNLLYAEKMVTEAKDYS